MSTRGDPFGKRALFGPPVTTSPAGRDPAAGSTGRRALFSEATDVSDPPRRLEPSEAFERARRAYQAAAQAEAADSHTGQVVVECGSCGARTAMGPLAVAVQLVPSVWIPGRRRSRLMRCPHCHRPAWCRVEWLALVGR
jgi:hypothetical protein